MYYGMEDFEEMASLAEQVRKFYPREPVKALNQFMQTYSKLVAGLVLGMAWNYLEAENILHTGRRIDPLESAREWEPNDFTKYQKSLRN
jgi:hypothetical protein